MTTFFYFAGVAFRLCAVVLVALSLIALFASSVRERLLRILRPIAWVFLAVASVIGAAYLWELFGAVIVSNPYERYTFWHARAGGSYGWAYWLTLALVLTPQLFWFAWFRSRPLSVFFIAAVSLLPSATERLVITITS